MEIRYYLQILDRRKWVVIITALVTVLVVAGGTFAMTPIYSASATVRIAQIQDQSVSYYDLNYTERLINTYVQLVRSRPFLEQVVERLELNANPTDLAEAIKAESIPNTELMMITAESSDPTTAMLVSNTLGQLLVEEGEKLYSGEGKSAREILLDQLSGVDATLEGYRGRLQTLLAEDEAAGDSAELQDLNSKILVQEQTYSSILNAYEEARLLDEARANSVSIAIPADLPDTPSKPRTTLNLLLGGLVGIASGVGLAALFENLDMSIYSPEDLHVEAQSPFLGSVPHVKVPPKLRGAPFLLQQNGKSSAAEAFRLIRSGVLTLDFGRPPRSLLVTSVEPAAGKSTVLANLAVALGQSGRSVVVLDCDLRKPSLDQIFGITNERGIKTVIAQDNGIESAIFETRFNNVKVVPSGPRAYNPSELLGLPKMREIVRDLENWADVVLLDSPPLLQFSDAVMLAPYVDGIALVVSRGTVTERQIDKALAQLAKAGAEQIGIIFNRALAR